MPDLEKAIKWLETAKRMGCLAGGVHCAGEECPYYYQDCADMIQDILTLLKAQRPRLITQEEFFNHPDRSSQGCLPLWYEEKCGKQGWCFVYYLAQNPDERKRYWTSRPNTKQMEATPWET